jgi:F-type H+-transporting ATPase subunit epsilon
MQLDILTPDKKVFSGEVESTTLPGTMGEFQILNNHAPIISTLKSGNLKYRAKGNEVVIAITGGLVEVNSNKVIVLADSVAS